MTGREPGLVPALGFHRLTPWYDAVVGATVRERRFKSALIRQMLVQPGHQVLDLACGTGTLAIRLHQAQPGAAVTGVDGDPAVLAIASRKATRAGATVQFDQALSHDLPYPDRSFDRVVSSLFFHHLTWPQKEATAAEVLRVLKPGGELHVADWGRPTGPVMRALFLTVQLLDGFPSTRDHVQGRLALLFQAAGFAAVAVGQSFNTVFGTLTLYHARRPG